MDRLMAADQVMPSRSKFIKACIAKGVSKASAVKEYRRLKHTETYLNSTYKVDIDRDVNHGFAKELGSMFCISVRRLDREQHVPFRHAQQFKNELVGPENEMVEIYPAESRLVDTANQYWFWGFNDPEVRWPFGMAGRAVTDEADFLNAKQTSRGME